jgi:hypothetical protein
MVTGWSECSYLLILTMICLFIFSANVALTDTYNVPEDYSNIQVAIDVASSGDLILVGPGFYPENLDFAGKALSLQSTDGPEVTGIEPNGGTVVEIGPGGEIVGFTISHGSASFGSAISIIGTGSRIKGNIIENNNGNQTIWGNSASAIIEQNLFRNNSCDNQYLSAVVVFVNSSAPLIVNNIFVDNPCRAINSTLPVSGQPTVINNTIVRNRVGIRVDRRIQTSQHIYRNNIIVDNGIGLEVDFGNESYNPTWEYNLVFNNGVNYDGISDQTDISGNISANPFFADPLANDFRLLGGSPAIDAGTSTGAPHIDFENDVRPVDGNTDGVAEFDIGADEFASGISITVTGGNTQECETTGGSDIYVIANVFPPTVNISSVNWFLDSVSVSSGMSAEMFVPIGEHLIEVEAKTIDGEMLRGSSSIEITDTVAPEITAKFIDKQTDEEVYSINSKKLERIVVSINTYDTCDDNPMVNALSGIPISNGDMLRIKGNKNKLEIVTTEITLSATAQDNSGNISNVVTSLGISE